MTTPQYRIGVDLGGTKMEARVLAADGSEPVAPIRRDTPREDYARTVTGIRDLVTEAAQSVGAASLPVAVAIPGGICPVEDVVKNANATRLNGQPLHRDLEAAFGRPVRVENDANCFVMSEARDGAAAGAKTVFGVILGTGVGGGIVINGEVLSGANRIAGEWGHIPIPPHCGPDGRLCYCGARDCVEKHVSGPALEAAYFREAEKAARATEIAGLAGRDAVARRVYHQWLSTLASSMATIINVIDPDVVVLGGGVSNIPDLPDLLMIRLPHEAYGTSGAPPRTQVLRNRHGDSSGARGAAWLAA